MNPKYSVLLQIGGYLRVMLKPVEDKDLAMRAYQQVKNKHPYNKAQAYLLEVIAERELPPVGKKGRRK